jgi:transcriptional regulator with XRE-family HTH domain
MPTKEEVGRRVRLARFRHNMTLKDVAVKSGMSATHISEIERGKTSPTIGCLQKIAGALDERPAHFVEDVNASVAQFTRRSDRAKEFRCDIGGKVFVAETVTGGVPWGTLHVAHGSGRVGEVLTRPPGSGELVILCVAGMFRVTVGDQSAVLREGDTIQFPLEGGYELATIGEEPAELLAIAAYQGRSAW